jgi:hypothetical protein
MIAFLQSAILVGWLTQYLSPTAAFILWGLTGLLMVGHECYLIACDLAGIELGKSKE